MTTSTLRIMNGNDSYRSGSLQAVVQMLTSNEFPPGADGKRAMYPNDLHRLGLFGVQRVSQHQRLPGSITGNQDLGVWWDASYVVPDGMIFQLSVQRRTRGTGASEDNGRILLRTRASGPLWRLAINRVSDPLTNPNINPVIEGRFDFITLREAMALGCAIGGFNAIVLSTYNTSCWQRLVSHAKLAEGTPKPAVAVEQVQTEDGETVQVVSREKRRRINID